jgi:hypothetical protein
VPCTAPCTVYAEHCTSRWVVSMITDAEIEDERRRLRQVRMIVDLTCAMIAQSHP